MMSSQMEKLVSTQTKEKKELAASLRVISRLLRNIKRRHKISITTQAMSDMEYWRIQADTGSIRHSFTKLHKYEKLELKLKERRDNVHKIIG